MNRVDFDYVQSAIGYHFKNEALLKQAFTRKSYSSDHPGAQNNEVLEFYGDEALDLYVTKMMYRKFSKIEDGELVSEKNEGELTKLKSVYVSKKTLAQCVYNAGFYQFLYMGNSDVKNEAWKTESVNEDLFEAIVGAVAADCDWDFSVLEKVCERMLQMETVNNYVAVLVQQKSHELGFGEPVYRCGEYQNDSPETFGTFENMWETLIGNRRCGASSKNPKTGLHDYSIRIGEHFFAGAGDDVFHAKLVADKKAYNFLFHEEIKRKIKDIDYSNPVSQLHEFVQKKIIMEPIYDFSEYHDSDGNPVWRCTVSLEGVSEKFAAEDASKKDVKQKVASKLLRYIVDTVEEGSEEWEIPVFYSGLMAIKEYREKWGIK